MQAAIFKLWSCLQRTIQCNVQLAFEELVNIMFLSLRFILVFTSWPLFFKFKMYPRAECGQKELLRMRECVYDATRDLLASVIC